MTQEEKVIDAKEFASMMISCLLAVEFNKSKPNKAIKHTLSLVKARVTSNRIKAMCDNGLKSIYPIGWLSRQENNIGRIGEMSTDEYLKIGANL